MALITRKQAYDKLKRRYSAWCQMHHGAVYNCGYNDDGTNTDWVTVAAAREMERTWLSRTSGGYRYSVVWSMSVMGAMDFIARDPARGSQLNYHIKVRSS